MNDRKWSRPRGRSFLDRGRSSRPKFQNWLLRSYSMAFQYSKNDLCVIQNIKFSASSDAHLHGLAHSPSDEHIAGATCGALELPVDAAICICWRGAVFWLRHTLSARGTIRRRRMNDADEFEEVALQHSSTNFAATNSCLSSSPEWNANNFGDRPGCGCVAIDVH